MPAPPNSAQQAANRAAAAAASAGRSASPGAAAGTGARPGGGAVSGGRAGSASPGGSQNQGGQGRSASPGAASGTGARSGSPGGSQNQGSGNMGARSANAATGAGNYGGSNSGRGGIMGGVGNVGNYNAGGSSSFGSPAQMNALHGLNRVDRQLVDVGARLGKQYGLGTPAGIVGASEIAKTIEGELGPRYSNPANRAAVAQNIMNRLDLAAKTGRYGKSLTGVLKGYDATGYDQKRVGKKIGPMGVSAFQNTKFGTPTYSKALTSLDKQMAGTGPMLPDFVQNATNYHNPKTSRPSWGRNAQSFGPHAFSNPDPGYSAARVASLREKGPSTALAMGNMPGLSGGMPTGTPGVTQVASAEPQRQFSVPSASQPWERAQAIPEPNVPFNAAAYNGRPKSPNMNMAGYSSPMSNVGSLPAQPGNMNMAGYNSPMAASSAGMPQVPSNMNMAGYQSPMTGINGLPQAPSNMSMAGYNSPMAGVGSLPVQQQQVAKMQDRIAPSEPKQFTDRIAPEVQSPMAGQGALNPQVADLMSEFGKRHLNTGLPEQYADTNPNRSFAGIPSSGFPRQQTAAAPADPAQFANSPFGRGLGALGAAVGSGIGALNKGMRQYEENKGLIGLAKAVGVNPIGKAVKTAASSAIRSAQSSLGGYSSGATQMAQSGSLPGEATQANTGQPAPQQQTATATLMGMLERIMSNGGPKTPREANVVKKIAQAIGNPGLDYTVTETAV